MSDARRASIFNKSQVFPVYPDRTMHTRPNDRRYIRTKYINMANPRQMTEHEINHVSSLVPFHGRISNQK